MSDFDAGFVWGAITAVLMMGNAVGFYTWARYRR